MRFKTNIILIITILLLHFTITSYAQSSYSINGVVRNEQGQPVESATVFLSGSSQITKTNANGRFSFNNLSSGSYEVVVRMLGYSSLKANALINSRSIVKLLVLSPKSIQLNEVQIGKGTRRDKYLKTFFDTFIGVTKNAAFCTILNPEVIEFSTKGDVLQAYSEDFIIINNKSLGYKISYLLRDFSYDSRSVTTIYDGEYVFENLQGTEIQKKKWEKNRLQAYKGSFMQYLRSLYAGRTREEFFLTYVIDESKRPIDSLVNVNRFVSKANSNFINFQFQQQLKVVYVGKAIAPSELIKYPDPFNLASLPTSYLTSFVNKAVIDKKGSYVDYKSFRIEGKWGNFRLGDQLPFEYIPK